MADTTGHEIDDALAIDPLRQLGWRAEEVVWNQVEAPAWARYDLVVVRSTWDYAAHVREYLRTLRAIDDATVLANSLEVMRWNLDKIYLRELTSQRIPTIATIWGEASPLRDLARAQTLWDADLIIKPRVGAGSAKLHKIAREDLPLSPDEEAAIVADHGGGAYLVQPYLSEVAARGEVSLFFFDGTYSHAVRKVPRAGDFRSQEEFGSTLEAMTATPAQRAIARAVLDAIPARLLYARIDLVPYRDGFAVIECEVIEPALYFRYAPDSPARFARALDTWWRARAVDPSLETS